MTKAATARVYEQSGVGPENVDVVELHDCFSANELITCRALGLCGENPGRQFIDSGREHLRRQGRGPIRRAALISKGTRSGATGLAQCAGMNWQVRGQADKRQVKDAKIAAAQPGPRRRGRRDDVPQGAARLS